MTRLLTPPFTKEQDEKLATMFILVGMPEYAKGARSGFYRPHQSPLPWHPDFHLPVGMRLMSQEERDAVKLAWRKIYGDPSLTWEGNDEQ